MKIRPCGDSMLLVELEPAIDPVINERAILLASRHPRRGRPAAFAMSRPGIRRSAFISIRCRPIWRRSSRRSSSEFAALAALDAIADRAVIEIPVNYGGAYGPDLDAVAAFAGCSADEVIARHSGRTYRVYMLGFVPGFAYMGRVDPSIAAPRHRVPRERVPAGSVGIAGLQTGVYPVESPGGWQLIGHTTDGDVRRRPRSAEPARGRATSCDSCRQETDERRRTSHRQARPADHGPGSWPLRPSGAGVPVAGPMDTFSHRLANQLAGNAADAATLEITLIGPELIVEADTTMAIAGGHVRGDVRRSAGGDRRVVRRDARAAPQVRADRAGRPRLSCRRRRRADGARARQPRDAPGQPHGRLQRPRAARPAIACRFRTSRGRGRSGSRRA